MQFDLQFVLQIHAHSFVVLCFCCNIIGPKCIFYIHFVIFYRAVVTDNEKIVRMWLPRRHRSHYDDVSWTLCILKSPINQKFVWQLTPNPNKETSKSALLAHCAENSPVTGEFPAQRASDAEKASTWGRHHQPWRIWAKSTCIETQQKRDPYAYF